MMDEMKRREVLEKEKHKSQIESKIRQEEFRKKIDNIILAQQN